RVFIEKQGCLSKVKDMLTGILKTKMVSSAHFWSLLNVYNLCECGDPELKYRNYKSSSSIP
ncbi:MAG: hypothetical protein OXK80_00005, partial [Bdellovibrionales bacterium]|nr:hypothetical protein [Bdellovibrionales bacterium]